jgi:hypothetical protein
MALALLLPAKSVTPDAAIRGINVPSPDEIAEIVNSVAEAADTVQDTADAVPALLISAPVKLVGSMASLNAAVKFTETELVVAAWPAARTKVTLRGATLSLVKTTRLVHDALL